MKVPIPIQPRDPNDELYEIIKRHLMYGDRKIIALNLEVPQMTVSHVSRGVGRSKKVWKAIMELVIRRKEEKDHFLKYLKAS